LPKNEPKFTNQLILMYKQLEVGRCKRYGIYTRTEKL